MKELTIEEKAERYEKALVWMQDLYPTMEGAMKEDAEHYFPELKEREDEKIKNALIRFHKSTIDVDGIKGENIIAWLEKQGEHKPTDKYNIRGIKSKHAEGKLGEMIKNLKSSDKVEPKFHKGEWVIFNEHHNSVYQVEKIQGLRYYLRHYLGGTLSIRFDSELIRKWTLQDAKSGDVLASNCSIFIFSQEYMAGKPEAHCGIMNGFFIAKPEGCWTNEKIYPATKEQRYALFAKMREAGYEWDAEKKELKKIEQNPAWSEEDAEMVEGLNNCLDELEEENGWKYVYVKDKNVELTEIRDWMKALKDRVMPQPKQEWSEEDEDMLDNIIDDYDDADEHNLVDDIGKVMWLKLLKERVACEANCTTTKQWSEEDEVMLKVFDSIIRYIVEVIDKDVFERFGTNREELFSWIKSIKDRYTWKPSSIQMECLHDAIEHYHTNGYPASKLTELYEQLSKIYKL